MIDEKPPNLVENWGRKSKDQSDEKSPNPVGDWEKKSEDQW